MAAGWENSNGQRRALSRSEGSDGIPSSFLRTYMPSELRAMTKPFADYDWEIGVQRARHNPTRICYLIGVPSAKRADSKNTGQSKS